MELQKLVHASEKNNFVAAAYEGGHRLSRRDKNIMTAFTYGKKL